MAGLHVGYLGAHMGDEENPRIRALNALEAARHSSREEAQSAQVYAISAVAEALLALHDVLVDVRDQLERISRR